MNRYRMQFAPGVWRPHLLPRLVRWIRPLRLRHQYKQQRLVGIHLENGHYVRDAIEAGDGVIIMPNHSSHADPHTVYMMGDEIGTSFYIMATWHVFHDQSWLARKILQWHGCFSVDREANDIGAFRFAVDLLEKRTEPLVVFPEGEVYHCNERVTPFREGAAAIAIAAARKAKRRIVCIPAAFSYRYVKDPTPELENLMGELEEAILWKRQPGKRLEDRIYRFAEGLLALKEVEYFGHCHAGTITERIFQLREHILEQVESSLGISKAATSIPERVKNARRVILENLDKLSSGECVATISSNETTSVEHLKSLLDDLFLVVQSFSYPGDYVLQRPSVERIAETLDKFEEDVLKRTTATIRGERTVRVQLGEPIVVSGDRKQKIQPAELSLQVETRVQDMLCQMRGPSAILQSESLRATPS